MADKTIFQLVGEYANALGKYGPGSRETRMIREFNADNEEFLGYADGLDSVKRHLGGRGMTSSPSGDRALLADALAELRRLEWFNAEVDGCPSCGYSCEHGHAPDCTLAAVLTRANPPG